MSPVTVVSVGDTETFVIAALADRRHEVQLVRRCPALDELLAACQSGLAQVAVVAECAPDLTATLIDRLTAVGVSVVAVAASAPEYSRLKGIGAHPVTAQVTAEVLAGVVRAAVEGRRHPGSAGYAVPSPPVHRSGPHPKHDAGTADAPQGGTPAGAGTGDFALADGGDGDRTGGTGAGTGSATGWRMRLRRAARTAAVPAAPVPPTAGVREKVAPSSSAPPQAPAGEPAGTRGGTAGEAAEGHASRSGPPDTSGEDRRPGTLVAVWGPIGSPGRTTLAMNLAAEQAAAGAKVMLVDADSYGASIAASLGLLDESASFAQACRVADQGGLTPERLAGTASALVFKGGTFSLLTGLTRADRWPELRAAAVERVLKAAQDVAEVVIVDCGFALENDEELSYDTVAPRRNAAALQVLGQADLVLAVGSGDPVGIPRLIRGLDALAQHFPAAEVVVVVNKVRRRAVGAAPEKALAQAWERFGPQRPISHFLPWDPELTDRALLEGRLLLELSPDAPLRRAISGISVSGCAADQRNLKIAVSKATARL